MERRKKKSHDWFVRDERKSTCNNEIVRAMMSKFFLETRYHPSRCFHGVIEGNKRPNSGIKLDMLQHNLISSLNM